MIRHFVFCLCVLMMGCQDWQYDECVCVRDTPKNSEVSVSPEPSSHEVLVKETEHIEKVDLTKETDTMEKNELTLESSTDEATANAMEKVDLIKETEIKSKRSHKDGEEVAKLEEATVNAMDECVNINQDDIPKLTKLPGVGTGKAKAIIQAREKRPFKRKKDITRVKGIGLQTYKKMSDHICDM